MTNAWYSGDTIHTFGRVLIDAGVLDTPVTVLDYFDKPYHWNREHGIWLDHYSPTHSSEDRWEAFVEAIL